VHLVGFICEITFVLSAELGESMNIEAHSDETLLAKTDDCPIYKGPINADVPKQVNTIIFQMYFSAMIFPLGIFSLNPSFIILL